ncbi:hypothetical protein QBC39DRAFT_327151 [Podospora conica]|nr:hypothetical protein QBC39DRAFT_327151 [Schizothecium conicum]
MSWETPNTSWGGNGDSWDTGATNPDNGWGSGGAAAADDFGNVGATEYGGGDARGGDFGADNFDNGDARGGGGDGGCFNCGEDGHMKNECPNPRAGGGGGGACFNCGEEGFSPVPSHMKSECPQPRIDRAPEGPCRRCGEEGHYHRDCKGAKKIDRSHLPDVTTDEAWALIVAAVQDRDIDDIKEAIQVYIKASPDTTYVDLETAFRAQNIDLFLIATERELAPTFTNMDLQGNMEKTYSVSYRLEWNPPRPRDRELWPKDVEENLERLGDAGEVTHHGLPQCRNCDQIGHISKHCTEEKNAKERMAIMCYNCDQPGHRVRDCPTPRIDKFACKNCNQAGHKASDCPEPRSAANVECRKCNEMGHFSKDCPTGGGGGACHNCGNEGHFSKDCTEERRIKCRNCDEFGHMSKECPKPRNMERVKCMNCQEMGHFKSRCPNPPAEVENENNYGGNGGNDFGAKDFGANDTGDNTGGGEAWGAGSVADEAPAAQENWGAAPWRRR